MSKDTITHDHGDDGIDRRGFLRCMAWAGTGMLWTMGSGVLRSSLLARDGGAADGGDGDLFFVQISDSHIGFDKGANHDVTATLQSAIERINALPRPPAFLVHTGDISQLSKPGEFDTARQVIAGARTRTGEVFYVPGEHDVLGDAGAAYRARYGRGTKGNGWYSFDHSGVHFVALVNVLGLEPGGLGRLGEDQLAWLRDDVRHLSSSTPIVVLAHVPLWTVYPEWGWGTDDGARALSLLRRFGSVTVLNGHIHQVMRKVEGQVSFHTAMSTAFPQPAPGTAPAPGPLTVPAGELRDLLGLTAVTFTRGRHALALVDDVTLSGVGAAEAAAELHAHRSEAATRADSSGTRGDGGDIAIANFTFSPAEARVASGARVTWTNRDDVPHQIVSADGRFASSPVLDTGGRYSLVLREAGVYRYYCALHPHMVGRITARTGGGVGAAAKGGG